MLDVFNHDAFSVISLTNAIRDLKYKPSRIMELGLFTPVPVTTTNIAIERIGDMLQLVKPSPRGGPGETRDMPKAKLRSFQVPHFQRDWSVVADEVQGVRDFGSENRLKTVQGVVAGKMMAHMSDFALTEEHARLGAIKGIITYADGSTLNLFNEFGIRQKAAINFDLARKKDGALNEICGDVIHMMCEALGGVPYDYVHAFCGRGYFKKLLKSEEVRETYKGWSDAKILREAFIGTTRGKNRILEFGGIVWEEYLDFSNTGVSVGDNECHLFPVGVPNLFQTYYAPADLLETVNTPGRRLYAQQWRMPNNKGINGEMQMNALQLCTRPATLLKGTG